MVRVFIVDRQPLFRQGIASSFSQLPDMEVCGEGDPDEKILSAIETCLPDVVLVDADSSAFDGLKICHAVKQRLPSVAVVVLTPQLDDEQLFQAIKTRASAYLNKEVTIDTLVETIRRCARGEHPINGNLTERPRVAEQILQEFYNLTTEREVAGFISPLTVKEKEILDYMAQGYLNKQIAAALSVSEQTIKNHVTSILRKLNANARTEAVVIALKEGLISL